MYMFNHIQSFGVCCLCPFLGWLGIYSKLYIGVWHTTNKMKHVCAVYPKNKRPHRLTNAHPKSFFHRSGSSYQQGRPSIRSLAFGARSMDRQKKIQVLAEAIYEGFIKDDGGEWLARTGNVVVSCNLRVQKTRKAFQLVYAAGGIRSTEKRFWTKAAFRDALQKMVTDRGLQIPMTSGFSWSEWLKDQASSLQELSQRARKNAWRMDALETLPYDPSMEDWVQKHEMKPWIQEVVWK